MKKLYTPKLKEIYESIQARTAKGIQFTRWIPWIFEDHSEWIKRAVSIKEDWISSGIEVVVIIGTGGSYLGAKACLEFVNTQFKKNHFEFLFLPYFSDRCVQSAIEYLTPKKFAIVVISKSGKTLESAVTFRLLRELLFQQTREEHFKYIIAITSKDEGLLSRIATKHRYHIFEIDKYIGGRYSTLTPVGLVPAILSGISGEDLIRGARDCHTDFYHLDYSVNVPFQYAAYRHFFFDECRLSSECLISYEPQLNGVLHKMKQLFSESEGKNNKGLLPVILDFTPDLHSVGQLLQEGNTSFFETVLWVNDEDRVFLKESVFENEDELDWLREMSLKKLNYSAMIGTIKAHSELKRINVLLLNLPNWSGYTFGYLYFFLCLSAMFSAYLLDQNPFDQPGVEAYKSRMISLLKSEEN